MCFFNQMSITTNENAPQWCLILEWTGCTIRSFSLSTPMIPFVSLFCTKLEQLFLQFITISSQQLRTILSNNIATLQSLHLDCLQLTDILTDEDLPVLQITDLYFTICNAEDVFPILCKCPHLTSLHFDGFDMGMLLANCIAMSCKHLKVLQLNELADTDNGAILLVAQSCPELECLSVPYCDAPLCEVLYTFTNLQKLEIGSLRQLGLGVFELQSLRVVKIIDSVSVHEFRQFSKGCPNLGAIIAPMISIYNARSVLEFCPKLRYLHVGDIVKSDEVLKSAAMYCPLLRTLNLTYSKICTPEWINRILRSCPQVDMLVLTDVHLARGSCIHLTNPLISTRVAVTREGPLHFPSWVPP